jgi:hypothetical protein
MRLCRLVDDVLAGVEVKADVAAADAEAAAADAEAQSAGEAVRMAAVRDQVPRPAEWREGGACRGLPALLPPPPARTPSPLRSPVAAQLCERR